jgi:hypothetical protein
MLPFNGCPECEEDVGLNQVICYLPLDIQNVRESGTKSSDMLSSIGFSECEEHVGLDEVICTVLLDVQQNLTSVDKS